MDNEPAPRSPLRLAAIVAMVSALAAAGLTALLVNIFQKKQEAQNPFFRVVELTDQIDDPAVWGKDFPLQYDQYRRTVDQVRTKYGGSEAVPRTPTQADPRSVVSQSKIEERAAAAHSGRGAEGSLTGFSEHRRSRRASRGTSRSPRGSPPAGRG
jgi:hypothetical protein